MRRRTWSMSRIEELGKDAEGLSSETQELLVSLKKGRGWRTNHVYFFSNFWCPPREIQAIIAAQRHLQAQDTDIVLATVPKSGTTWVKALIFAIVNRHRYNVEGKGEAHPLLFYNPHELVPFLEYKLYANNHLPDLSGLSAPRLFATHIPYAALPSSVKDSSCRIIYTCRNPLDTFVSSWHFVDSNRKDCNFSLLSLEEAFDLYCEGIIGFGPYWEHMLGYWKESLEKPDKVLFLMYEDLIEDVNFQIKRLSKFLGVPFSKEELSEKVEERIVDLCSFEHLKVQEINKTGKAILNFKNETLFRKGKVGDWKNMLSPAMVEKLQKVLVEKLGHSGLTFKYT